MPLPAQASKPSSRGHLSLPIALLLACLVLLPTLGHRPLTDWDEGIYAEIAREMLAGRSWRAWLVPHWNGQLWFEKPPLQMWLTACSLRLFGLNAFAARLPSVLAGVAITGLTYRWLQRRFGLRAASLGTVLLLSAFGFQHAARAGETDTLLSLFCLVSVMGLADVLENKQEGWLLFWSAFALALMTKGAASITLPLTAVALAVFEPSRLLRFPRSFLAGALLFLAIALPWHTFLLAQFGQAFLHEYLGFHVLRRATTAIEGHTTHPWFYLWVLLVSAPPFALLYPWALALPFRRQASADDDNAPLRAFAVFALLTLGLFSLVRTRLPHYIAPVYPTLSILTAVMVEQWLQRRADSPRPALLKLAAAGLLAYAVAATVTIPARRALHSPRLPNGRLTPDNREAANLLQRALRSHDTLPPGPLLLWRTDTDAPITTAAFYAHRLAQPVSVAPLPNAQSDRYSPPPTPLASAIPAPRLILLEKALLPTLPPGFLFQPLEIGPTQVVGLVAPPR